MNSTLKQHYSRSNTTASTKHTKADSVETENVPSATVSTTDETLSNASSSRKKRCELTQSAMKKVNVHECDVVVHFS